MNPGRLKTSTVLTRGAGNHTWLNKLCDLHEERPDWYLGDTKKGLFSLEKTRETGIQSPSTVLVQPPQYGSRSDLSRAADLFCGYVQLPVFIPHIFLSES